jgi:two-component system, OmpR family, phosphate regulon sensor histidine kinase PhoR
LCSYRTFRYINYEETLSRNTIKLVLILGVIAISGIIAIQIYWVKKAFDLKDQQFRQSTMVALRNVANQISKSYKLAIIDNPVSQYSSDYYVVNLRVPLQQSLLEHLLKEEFKKSNINTDFEYGIYDCETDKIVFGAHINSDYEVEEVHQSIVLPTTDKFLNYFGVKFPNQKSYLTSKLDFWIVSSIITMLVMAFFAYAMFVILKQKRLSGVQRDFINNMTHEFQTPISTIKIATDVLAQSKILEQPERFKKYVQIIKQENNRLKNQVESVLATARIGKGQIELDIKLQELHEIIGEVSDSVKAELEENFTLDLNATKTTINADRMHLMNVIRNLVDNAIKYSGKPPKIKVSTRNENNLLIVSILDKGIGIPKDALPKIFNKFYRVPTGNLHNVRGFGLGLNYVKEIINLHKWKIIVNSEVGVGSAFEINIPLPD